MKHGHRCGRGRGEGGRRRGGRARRGDVRLALLSLLAEQGGSGYALMKRIEDRTDGVWRTSPGSIYPTLSQLVDEGLVTAVEAGGGRSEYEVTEAGRAHVSDHMERIVAIWAGGEDEPEGRDALRRAVHQLMGAARRLDRSADGVLIAEAAQRVKALAEELEQSGSSN